MLNSERKKIHVLRNKKNKYSNSCLRKNNSERKKTPQKVVIAILSDK